MRCDQIEPRLDAFIDGELPTEELSVLESHLEGCSSCGRELQSRRELRRIFADRPSPSTPPDLRKSILAAAITKPAHGRTESNSGKRELPRWRRARWSLAFAAAAALAFVIVVPHLGEREPKDEGAAPFTTPARVVVPRFGESADEGARVEFGGIDLNGVTQRRSK